MAVELVSIIPGGSAEWFSRLTLSPRKERVLQVELVPLKPLLGKVTGGDLDLTGEEMAQLLSVNELGVVTFLKSWTVTNADGTVREIPKTVDEVLDLDRDLYDALVKHAAKLMADAVVDDFSVDSVEDLGSPTGA